MKQKQYQPTWGTRSVSFWLTFITAACITFIGLRYMLLPALASNGFGLPLPSGRAAFYGSIKGIRDIFSGLILFFLLATKQLRATKFIYALGIIIPITDCIVILTANGVADNAHWTIHCGTALFMAFNSILLFKVKPASGHLN